MKQTKTVAIQVKLGGNLLDDRTTEVITRALLLKVREDLVPSISPVFNILGDEVFATVEYETELDS